VRGYFRRLLDGIAQRQRRVGQDRQDGASDDGSRAAAVVRIDESIATLEPIWVERFEQDIAKDTATERRLIVKAWVVAIGVCFLLLIRRLFE
jgi:hypothetical protein